MVGRVLIAFLLVLLVGCGKSVPPSAATTAADQEQIDLALSQLTQVVRKYAAEQRRAPATLDEVVTNGYLTEMPRAPAGRKFAINKNLQVYLVNQ